jgi:3-methylcrotonyl-CoA carboxylase alpha subunit/geranyl-CoA carboxylase alpha subunit
LSEDAAFAQAVQDAGLTWIGPPPAAIRALGSKSAAKALAARHGVPCLPGYAGDDQSEARFIEEAARVGYPVMVKAVAGGGGRGMRLVLSADQLPAALASARAEALAGFGNGDLLIERALLRPRHVEVQVFADAHGHVIHLGERDCSVQRRHQKIIEEAPSPAVDAALREQLGECAVTLARAAGYVGAGTVEFLLDADQERGGQHQPPPGRPKAAAAPSGGSAEGEVAERGGQQFWLMEMNTRLQVEHPVTEALTGLDLVEWQIRVARGEALPLAQDQVRLTGHAIEVRLCAEDEKFVPHAGRVLHFAPPPDSREFERAPLRLDHALQAGSKVTPYYDAMLGKLIVHADTRADAIDQLVVALGRLELLGLPTNRAFLIECLQDQTFRDGDALIAYLDERAEVLRDSLYKKELLAQARSALAVVFDRRISELPCAYSTPVRLRHRDRVHNLSVRVERGGVLAYADGDGVAHHVIVRPLGGGLVEVSDAGGVTTPVRAVRVPQRDDEGQAWHLQSGAIDWWLHDVSFAPTANGGSARAATELRAPFNGKVVRLLAQSGQALAAGETALVVESMKLEHSLSPRTAVTVTEVLVAEGQQVSPGQVLLRFAPPADSA